MSIPDALEIGLLVVIAGVLWKRKVEVPSRVQGSALILDSCALIDGRITELAKSGFVPQNLIVPKFIIQELQTLADGKDTYKRERARFGLDVVKQLQDSHFVTVIIDELDFSELHQTDDKLVALAKKRSLPLYTTDFNLNKVAEIDNVRVLNVNELAQNLRPVALPGERHKLKVLQRGSSRDQGVGYLPDGTMVVVENGAKQVGKTVEIEVTRVFQTMAGKMMFAVLISKR